VSGEGTRCGVALSHIPQRIAWRKLREFSITISYDGPSGVFYNRHLFFTMELGKRA